MNSTGFKLSASKVGREIDKSNDDLGRDAEDGAIVRERALRWVEALAAIGITDATIEAVFQRALADKRDNFRLNRIEVQAAARKVVSEASKPNKVVPLEDWDCDFILSMIPNWYSVKTEQSRVWLIGQRESFRRNASTPKEREVLAAFEALDLGEVA